MRQYVGLLALMLGTIGGWGGVRPALAQPPRQFLTVDELSGVTPNSWARQALQSLQTRYGCLKGYPEGNFLGNQALTRYEFAAGLEACLAKITNLARSGQVRPADLGTLQRLQQQFAAELAKLDKRITPLETHLHTLDAQQFNPLTKLSGEVIFEVEDAPGTQNALVAQNRVRLDLQTSFTGHDLLHTRIGAGNSPSLALNGGVPTAVGNLALQTGYTGESASIDWLAYYFPAGKHIQFYVAALSGTSPDYLPTTANSALDQGDGGTGSLTLFGAHNAIYNIGGGTGAGFNWQVNSRVQLGAGYLAGPTSASDPTPGNGLFNGDCTALGQLTLTPTPALTVALTYANGYDSPGTPIFNYAFSALGGPAPVSGVEGTSFANFPGGLTRSINTNSYGISLSYQVNPKLMISAWGDYTQAQIQAPGTPDGEVWNYALALASPDLFKKGNLGGLIIGADPYLGNPQQVGYGGVGRAVPLHVEVFYRYQVNDFFAVTPGIIYLDNPNQQPGTSNTILVLRNTFEF